MFGMKQRMQLLLFSSPPLPPVRSRFATARSSRSFILAKRFAAKVSQDCQAASYSNCWVFCVLYSIRSGRVYNSAGTTYGALLLYLFTVL